MLATAATKIQLMTKQSNFKHWASKSGLCTSNDTLWGSPLQRIEQKYQKIKQQTIEKIRPYIIAPQKPRIKYIKVEDFTIEPLGPGKARITSIAVKKSEKIAFRIIMLLYKFIISVKAQIGNIKSQNLYIAELQVLFITLKLLKIQQSSLLAVIIIIANLFIF